jgi:hypothetical protein
MLSLAQAIKTKRLQDFIAQEEARGVAPADLAEVEILIREMITTKPQEDQTSHSPERDGSSGK